MTLVVKIPQVTDRGKVAQLYEFITPLFSVQTNITRSICILFPFPPICRVRKKVLRFALLSVNKAERIRMKKKKRKKRTRDTDVKNHEIHAHSTVVALKTKVSRLRHIQSQIET